GLFGLGLAGPTVGVTKEAPLSLPKVRLGSFPPSQGRQTAVNARLSSEPGHPSQSTAPKAPASTRLHRGRAVSPPPAIHFGLGDLSHGNPAHPRLLRHPTTRGALPRRRSRCRSR